MSGKGEKAEAARNKVQKALGDRSDIKYDMGLIESIGKSKVGGISGSGVLLDSNKRAEANKAEGSEEDYANVTKEANRKDSDSYGILKAIGDFTRTIAPFIQDPSAIFKNVPTIPVRIEEGSVEVDAT